MVVRELSRSAVAPAHWPAGEGTDDPFLTGPNLLTMARVPLGVLFCFVSSSTGASFVVMGLAGLTDVLDGWLARRMRRRVVARMPEPARDEPGRGAWLDPLCDKVFLACVLVSLYVTRRPPVYVLTLIATRELLQAPLTAIYRLSPVLRRHLAYDFRSNPLGKLATLTQFMAVSSVLLRSAVATPLAAVAAGVGLLAVASYVRRAIAGYRHT